MIKLKNILFPSDFSEHSLAARNHALDLARKYDAKLHFLHVADDSSQYWMSAGDNVVPVVISEQELMETSSQQMNAFIDKYFADDRDVLTTNIVIGRPFLEIIRYAKDNNIDMIVMSTHGHGALASMLLGSVTEKVIRKSPCPVLTVRHEGHKFEMP